MSARGTGATSVAPEKVVHVVSFVTWVGENQDSGGFFWFPEADRDKAERTFHEEVHHWWSLGNTARVRLLTVNVPASLDRLGVTCWLDENTDNLETYWPARRVGLVVPERNAV